MARSSILAVVTAALLAASFPGPAAATDEASAAPAVLAAVAPVFPEIARKARLYGTVQVRVDIAPSGKVTGTEVVERGHERMSWIDDAAVAAAKRWRFEPAWSHKPRGAVLSFQFEHLDYSAREEVEAEDLTTVFEPPYGVRVRAYSILR